MYRVFALGLIAAFSGSASVIINVSHSGTATATGTPGSLDLLASMGIDSLISGIAQGSVDNTWSMTAPGNGPGTVTMQSHAFYTGGGTEGASPNHVMQAFLGNSNFFLGPGTTTLTANIMLGQPFQTGWHLSGYASAISQGESEFANLAMSLDSFSFFDVGGNPVSFPASVNVPEPVTWVSCALGIVLMLGWASLLRGRASVVEGQEGAS